MAIDPPASHFNPQSTDPTAPQPFEIALLRKVESKTNGSLRDAFLLLDTDRDGCISPLDMKTVLHNELGLDITKEQENCIFSRFTHGRAQDEVGDEDKPNGMKYNEFATYFNEVSSAVLPASASGSAAAMGFQSDEGNSDHELPIHPTKHTTHLQLRHQLRQALTSHSSRTHGGSGMKETSLFLRMDVHKSGKVTMQEFLDWLNSIGMDWDMEKLKLVVLGCDDDTEGKMKSVTEKHWFGSRSDGINEKGEEAGMTEHEFADFVESLDTD